MADRRPHRQRVACHRTSTSSRPVEQAAAQRLRRRMDGRLATGAKAAVRICGRTRDRNARTLESGDSKDAIRELGIDLAILVVRRLRAEAAATAEGGRNLLRWPRVRLPRRPEAVLREAGNRWEARGVLRRGENPRGANPWDVSRATRRIEDLMDLRAGMVPRAEAMDLRAEATGR